MSCPTQPEALQTTTLEDEVVALERLQHLLVTPELAEFRFLVEALTQKLTALKRQIYEPTELIKLLLPWVAELLKQKVTESKEEVVRAIAPIIDQIIQNRGEQDKVARLLPNRSGNCTADEPLARRHGDGDRAHHWQSRQRADFARARRDGGCALSHHW